MQISNSPSVFQCFMNEVFPGVPQSVKELQPLLGFANFYSFHPPVQSAHSAPSPPCCMTSPSLCPGAPMPTKPSSISRKHSAWPPSFITLDPQVPFVFDVDASTTNIMAVLSQYHGEPSRLHPCAYFSRKLTRGAKLRHWELLAIKLTQEE